MKKNQGSKTVVFSSPQQIGLALGLIPLEGIELPILAKIRSGFAKLDLFIGTPEHKLALERYRSKEIDGRELFRLGWEYVRSHQSVAASSS